MTDFPFWRNSYFKVIGKKVILKHNLNQILFYVPLYGIIQSQTDLYIQIHTAVEAAVWRPSGNNRRTNSGATCSPTKMKDSGSTYKSWSILGTKCTMSDYSKARLIKKCLYCVFAHTSHQKLCLCSQLEVMNGPCRLDSKPGPCFAHLTSLSQANMLAKSG